MAVLPTHHCAHEMSHPDKALIIFLRYPRVGRVKSRLATQLGDRKACEIYEKLVRRTLGVATDFKRSRRDVDILAFFTPANQRPQLEKSYPGPWKFFAQSGTHIGDRMDLAIRHAFSSGYRQVILVGTDIANLETSDFEEAFESLRQGFAVLNPASDGGFYLIGLNHPCPSAFAPTEWSTATVFQRTNKLLGEAGFEVRINRERNDVDRPEDVIHLNEQPLFQQSLSIIIPTKRNVDKLRPMLDALAAQLWPGDEIIVSFSGTGPSSNDSASFSPSIRLVHSPPGRGIQLNRGAQEAKGSLLWFLHDDSIPPDQFGYYVRKISIDSRCSLGCFLLGYAPSNHAMDLISRWANFRTRHLGLPYGDQGLFCRSKAFQKLGGFRHRYIMEDVDFVRRSKQIGRLLIIPEVVHTSPERYLGKGILRASLENHLTMLLYLMGVDEHKLYYFYYR